MAAACIISPNADLLGVIDSKATKESDRLNTYEALVNSPHVQYAVSVVSNDEIDQLNILQATMTAMSRCTREYFVDVSHY